MKAYIYSDKETAEKVETTMHKLGLDAQLVGSAVVAPAGEFELLREQTTAPAPTVIAEVK